MATDPSPAEERVQRLKLPLAVLPACSGATSRHLGTENGHFENTTHQVFQFTLY